ncbi:MAG: deoxyguanosinetriphosphate triphosphohydrolase [Limisphaerales bacterium]
MPCTREELEQREQQTLASYAQLSGDSRGRLYPEEPALWRTQFQRDRDRVIHSRAFRRLEYKTQVFLNGRGDHFRTRLTHTMEVAATTRSIARALRLNEDLAETIALAHDLGHSPFGHKGEEVLNKLMRGQGGFEHNKQSLRIVEELEQRYPAFRGLNLTWEVREGLMKHERSFVVPGPKGFTARSTSLEAQVANLADELTYASHDLDDGMEAGLLSEDKLRRDVKIFGDAWKHVRKTHGDLPDELRRHYIVRSIIDWQVHDVVENSEQQIFDAGVKSADDVRKQTRPLIQHSAERRKLNAELRKYLYANFYLSDGVSGPNQRAGRMLEELFRYYLLHPKEIGEGAQKRARKAGWHRAICDYLSGMTDRYAINDYQRIFGVSR